MRRRAALKCRHGRQYDGRWGRRSLGKTVIGRRYIAVGSSPAAALSSGIGVLSYQIGTYMLAAVRYGVAGVLLAGFIGYASPTAGSDYLLPSIAAVVVGGTPFTGGRGSVVASGVAALFMAQLGQMVLALGAGPAEQLFVQAATIVVATSIRHLSARAFLLPKARFGFMARKPILPHAFRDET
jgi:ribose transport system permease protein